MLAEGKLKQLTQLVENFSKEELIWVNGYLVGLSANGGVQPKISTNGTAKVSKISIVFGTETGNSKRLATLLATAAKKQGIQVKLIASDQYRTSDLEKEEFLFVVISTHGDGEPPASARAFYDYIHQSRSNLVHLKYGILALGDSSYPQYCKTGIEVDQQLEFLGGKRILSLQKCDVDYEEDAQQWIEQVLNIVGQNSDDILPGSSPSLKTKTKTGKKFYNGIIRKNINLNDRGSKKQTFHIEIDSDEMINYEVGDAMGIIPSNKKIMVDLILYYAGVDKDLIVETDKKTGTVEELLINHLNICYLLPSAIAKYATITQQEIPDTRIDLVDLLELYPLGDASQIKDVIKILSPIAPRLYSISSSPVAHGENEIHLTVSRHSFKVNEEQRFGLCSDFLGELPIGTALNFYIHKNRFFKLPDVKRDVIMIGPGTGIAPFRAFLAERDAIGAEGRNWLFFGDQHFTTDFLYQAELQNLNHTGVLSKISLAFSRDQPEKKYVQHKIVEEGHDLFDWIQNGASVYLCGTKDPNSVDIEKALLQVIRDHGQLSAAASKNYLAQLEQENRFVKDVY